MFRSRTEALAERAEVDGRFDDAARLYVECGARAEAFRVLMRAAESSKLLSERRGYLARAYAIARTDELRAQAKKGLALVTLAECESQPPRNDEERARLTDAAADLEASASHREAARAYKLLGQRDAVERMLMLSGDVEAFEQEAGADQAAERARLRRRNAIESFHAMWATGDRARALGTLEDWLRGHDDQEVRALRDERAAGLLALGRFEARIEGVAYAVVGRLPVTFGREGNVVLRGASVSREHCVVEQDAAGQLVVRDNGSRNGTQVAGINLAGAVPLGAGQSVALGADLTLKVVSADAGAVVLEVDRGMDRGKRVVLVQKHWDCPLGRVRFDEHWAVLEPREPVRLGGQRVAAPITLARGDRIERDALLFEVGD